MKIILILYLCSGTDCTKEEHPLPQGVTKQQCQAGALLHLPEWVDMSKYKVVGFKCEEGLAL